MRNSFCRFSKLYSTDIAVEHALQRIRLAEKRRLSCHSTDRSTDRGRCQFRKIFCEDKKESAETYLKINLEAAKETARQIRLRNISGIILIDFINMDDLDMMQELLKQFRRFLGEDPIQTSVWMSQHSS